MRHRSIRLMTMLLALLLLVGCGIDREDYKDGTAPHPETTAATTQAAEPPVMDAENIYWKMHYTVMNKRVDQYKITENVDMRMGTSGVYVRMDIASEKEITRSLEPYAINAHSCIALEMMNMEIELLEQSYYRLENDELVRYTYNENQDDSERTELTDIGATNYEFFHQFNGIYIPGRLPADLTVEDQTQLVGDRETYVLQYWDSVTKYASFTDDAQYDDALEGTLVPVKWYVDVETFQPVKWEVCVDEASDQISEVLTDYIEGVLGDQLRGMTVEINSYSKTVTDMVFGTVDVPEIPEDVIKKAEEKGGHSEL